MVRRLLPGTHQAMSLRYSSIEDPAFQGQDARRHFAAFLSGRSQRASVVVLNDPEAKSAPTVQAYLATPALEDSVAPAQGPSPFKQLYGEQGLVVLDRLPVFDQDVHDLASELR